MPASGAWFLQVKLEYTSEFVHCQFNFINHSTASNVLVTSCPRLWSILWTCMGLLLLLSRALVVNPWVYGFLPWKEKSIYFPFSIAYLLRALELMLHAGGSSCSLSFFHYFNYFCFWMSVAKVVPSICCLVTHVRLLVFFDFLYNIDSLCSPEAQIRSRNRAKSGDPQQKITDVLITKIPVTSSESYLARPDWNFFSNQYQKTE